MHQQPHSHRPGLARAIMALAIPAIVSNITTPLLGLIDVAIVGHIGRAEYIAAIAVGGAMFNMVYWLFGFLRMGTVGLTAQAYGGGRDTAVVLWRSLTVAVAVGAALVLLQHPIAVYVLGFMDADGATAALARTYFDIGIWGAPAVLASYAMAGWFVGMQNSRAMMWVAIATDVANIGVSLALVFGFGLEIRGVACGTVAAQYLGMAVAAAIIWRRYRPGRRPWRLIMAWDQLRRFFSINLDIFMRTLCLVAVTMWFTHIGAQQGAVMLAVNALLMQLFTLFSYFMDGFAFAGEALAGLLAGAGQHGRLRRAISGVFVYSGATATLFTVLYLCAGQWAMGMLTDDGAVVDAAAEYLPWAVSIPLLGFVAFAWDGIFIGLTLTRGMLASMAAATAVFFGVYLVAYPAMGNHGLWLAFIAYLATRGIVQTILYRYVYAKRRQ